jgi:predicted TIM-barrel fold metal-dependent hydrolase
MSATPENVSGLSNLGNVIDVFGGDHRREVHTLLPDPEPSRVGLPLVSADDHFVEPPHVFAGRLPGKLADREPRVVDVDGVEYWDFEGELEPNRTAQTSIVGRPRDEWTREPVRFDEMRPGSYDPKERLRDMDLAGIAASLCFPSAIFGFAGQRFYRMKDHLLGLAAMRAYNDWIIEEWTATDPDRFVPQQVTWLPDPAVAAKEVERNASRGFKAVAFSENPQALGYPSLHTRHWDPFFAACEATGTVVNLHVGSSSAVPQPSTDSPGDVSAALFPVNGINASVDWVYSRIPVRFPELRIALSEAGVSWVPMVQERLRRNEKMLDASLTWRGVDLMPVEVFQRCFWFTSIEDYCGIRERHEVGVNRIMLEVDYPHPDTSWPNTQDTIGMETASLPDGEKRLLAYKNACALYRHPEAAVDAFVARRASELTALGS